MVTFRDKMKYKLFVIDSHPIQYKVPLWKVLSSHPQVELTVYFCWDFGVGKASYDPGFGRRIRWDVLLLDGFKFKFLRNLSPKPGASFGGQINPDIIKELHRGKPDAVLIQGIYTISYLLALIAARIMKIPVLYRDEANLLKYRSFWKRVLKRVILTSLFKNIKAFFYSCSSNREYFIHYGVKKEKLFFLPCAVDNDFFRSQKRKLLSQKSKFELKKEIGIPINIPVILFCGKLIPRKRPLDILEALKLLDEDFVLLFVGDGVERPKLELYVKENDLKNVYFEGFKNQSELPLYHTVADIFVLPSEYDPSPKVVNEVMNFEVALILSDKIGTASDLVKEGENGFIYPVGDIVKLAYYLRQLLTNQKLTEKMGKRSFEIVARWNFEEDVRGIIKALKYTIAKRERK